MRTARRYPKSFNNWRIIDPISDFVNATVNPRQGLTIVLNSHENIKSEIESHGEMLIYDGWNLDKKNRKVHTFLQKYDLEQDCIPFSLVQDSVSLGSISVKLIGEKTITNSKLLVNLSRGGDNVVSAINPDKQLIRIHPHTKLKLLVINEDYSLGDNWNYKIDNCDSDLKLVSIGQGSSNTNNIWNPQINSCLYEEVSDILKKDIKPIHFARFFDFILDKESAKKTATMKSGNFILSKISLFSENKKELVYTAEVILNVPKERKPVKSFMVFSKENIIESPKKPLLRQEEKVNNLNTIINPGQNESIELTPHESISVQIVSPKHLYPNLDANARWKFRLESINCKLNMTSVADSERWGHTFQNVLVDLNAASSSESSAFAGAMIISLDSEIVPQINRRLSFWLSCPLISSRRQRCREDDFISNKHEYFHSHEQKIKRDGFTKRMDAYKSPARATDLCLKKIESKSFMDGISTTNVSWIVPTVTQVKPKPYVATDFSKKIETVGGTVYFDVPDGYEINLPASSKAIIRMPFKEQDGSMSCWAVKINEDRLIKVSDIKSSVNTNSSGFLELVVESTLSGEVSTSVFGGSLLFTSGIENRLVKIRVLPACKSLVAAVPFMPQRTLETIKKGKFRLVKSFRHRDVVNISPKDLLYVKIPTIIDGYGVSVDLVQKPIPDDVDLNYVTKNKLNPLSSWFPTGYLTMINRSVSLKMIEVSNPYWAEILKGIKDKSKPIHVADLIFQGSSANDLSVESSLGEIKQVTYITRILHVMLVPNLDEPRGKQISVFYPSDKTEVPVEVGDDVKITLKPHKVEADWEWPWFYSGADSANVEFVELEKRAGDYVMHLKIKEKPEGRDRITSYFSCCDGRDKTTISVQLVFKK